MTDREILRRTTIKFIKALENHNFLEKYNLQKALNDKKMIRPVVLLDDLPWCEFNIDGSLTTYCQDPYLRTIEQYMKEKMFQLRYFPGDMWVKCEIPVKKVFDRGDYGLTIQQHTLAQTNGDKILSHEYRDQLSIESGLGKLHRVEVTYDEQETMRRFQLVGDMIGDLIPIRLEGATHATLHTWDIVSELRGVEPLLYDLADEPEYMHETIALMTDIFWNRMEQMADLGLFDTDPCNIHCASAPTDDIGNPEDGSPRKLANVWGRGVAQIFASVSKKMHEEFDINYMIDTVGKCGLVYYGCCEPLDKKIDIVEKIPNLRKISITPWADVNIAAEAMGDKYVMASKPNPAALAVKNLDEALLRKEISEILDACKRNNCPVELTMKDVSTTCNNLQNVITWEKTVMEMVQNY